MVGDWLRWELAQRAAHWRDDTRRGFAFGLAVAAPALAWLGLR